MNIDKLTRLFFIAIGLLFWQVIPISAQTTSNSPYSRFGMGKIAPQYNMRSESMGGISQGLQLSGNINPANPASYVAFDSLTFLFDFAVTGCYNMQKSNLGTAKNASGSINYLTFGFPVVKWWRMSFGINPVSSVGYDIYEERKEKELMVSRDYWADGGTSRVYFGNAFKISKNWFIGLNVNYLFGNIDNYRMLYFPDSSYMRSFKNVYTTYLHDFTFRPGIQYSAKIKSDYKLTVGATYGFQKKVSATIDETVYSMLGGFDDDGGTDIDTITYDSRNVNISYPMDLMLGFTFEKPGNFLFGVDFSWTNWSSYKVEGKSQNLSDLWTINVGGEYIPSHLSSSKYGSRIAYRFGFYTYQKLYVVNGTNINEYAFTAGIGLPITRSKTRINIHASAGWLGTTNNNLIQETFFKMGIGISLSEMWFFKRKYL